MTLRLQNVPLIIGDPSIDGIPVLAGVVSGAGKQFKALIPTRLGGNSTLSRLAFSSEINCSQVSALLNESTTMYSLKYSEMILSSQFPEETRTSFIYTVVAEQSVISRGSRPLYNDKSAVHPSVTSAGQISKGA